MDDRNQVPPAHRRVLLSMVLGLAIITVISSFMITRNKRVPVSEPVVVEEPPPPPPEVVDEPLEIPVPTDATIPVTLVQNEFTSELAFEARKSRLDSYPEKSFYRMWGEFEAIGSSEIHAIDVRLELLDGDTVVTADAWQALATHDAPLRPGDHVVFEHLLQAKPNVDAARLTVTKLEKLIPGAYAESKPVELEWIVDPPEGVDLQVRERAADVRASDHFSGEWEFINRGTRPLNTVKYELRLHDRSGKLIDQIQSLATYSSAAPIEPGEARLEAMTRRAPGYASYTIAIVQID